MKKHLVKSKRRERRRRRSKGDTLGTKLRPRLVVYRSLSHIYAQLIDDIERDHAITKTEILEALYKIKSEIEDHNLKYEEETDY